MPNPNTGGESVGGMLALFVGVLLAISVAFGGWGYFLHLETERLRKELYQTQVEIDRLGEALALAKRIENLKIGHDRRAQIIETLEERRTQSFRKARLQIEGHQEMSKYKYYKR